MFALNNLPLKDPSRLPADLLVSMSTTFPNSIDADVVVAQLLYRTSMRMGSLFHREKMRNCSAILTLLELHSLIRRARDSIAPLYAKLRMGRRRFFQVCHQYRAI